ncbi:MAG: DUF721 domain-containing protein [Candidatus Omnitrophica bacterium]|nr:DUF721 domain-containing protein [Candidatus Omnitrophota bacterium]
MLNEHAEQKRKPVIIKDILENFLKDFQQQKQTPQAIILKNWKEIISESAAEESMPVVIKNKILIIVVSNSALLHHLTLRKKEIRENIEKFLDLKTVKGIRFKIGKINSLKI